LFKKNAMPSTSGRKRSAAFHRLIAAGLFLFVFCLPLHAHYSTSEPQVAKECACLHGSRTQMASATDAAEWIPSFPSSSLFTCEIEIDFSAPETSYSIRAPPLI
jgi:hypothetical protein